jgi:hypothetical protein
MRWHDDGCGYDWPGQRTTARFINAGHMTQASLPKLALFVKRGRWNCFGRHE